MEKLAFIFPGQGVQAFGMGKDFYDSFEVSRCVYDMADTLLDIRVSDICFEENDRLHVTAYTQAALLTTEIAILKAVESLGVKPDICAGLSLGEYGALVASGKLKPEDAIRLVRQRGIFMQEAVPQGGAMAAVLGLDGDKVREVCRQSEGIVELANDNCPGQVVISGEAAALHRAEAMLKAAGAKRVAYLNVSGPFHSSMLREAGARLKVLLQETEFYETDIACIANVTAAEETEPEEIRDLLEKQVSSSVLWRQSVRTMLDAGVRSFVEIGPGKTLAGFMRRIDRNAKVINIASVADLEKLNDI